MWMGRTPSWRDRSETKRRRSMAGPSWMAFIGSLLVGGGRHGRVVGEQVAGLAVELAADRLERGEADRLGLAGLEDRQVDDGDADPRRELGQRHAPGVQG